MDNRILKGIAVILFGILLCIMLMVNKEAFPKT